MTADIERDPTNFKIVKIDCFNMLQNYKIILSINLT